jgi:hypothetical protein
MNNNMNSKKEEEVSMSMSMSMGVVTSMGMSTAHGMCTDVCTLRACMSMSMWMSFKIRENSNNFSNMRTCMIMDKGKGSSTGKGRTA